MPYADKETLVAACETALTRLIDQFHAIRWACVASKDGMEIANIGTSGTAGEKLSVMVGTMLALADGIVGEASLGECSEIMLGAQQGRILIIGVHDPGEELVLACMGGNDISLGMLIAACNETARQIAATAAKMEVIEAEY